MQQAVLSHNFFVENYHLWVAFNGKVFLSYLPYIYPAGPLFSIDDLVNVADYVAQLSLHRLPLDDVTALRSSFIAHG